jgi:hypothetical protein
MEQGGMQETAFDLTKGQYIITSTPPRFIYKKKRITSKMPRKVRSK